jgi:cobalt-zinc-cadmium efflux system membrane fusion protein
MLVCAAWLLAGCKNRNGQEAERQGSPTGQAEQHEETPGHDAAAENLVRIDREMLRDLRVTTAAAEARPADDTVTVLGELRVNEEAYAEIGSPIAARVVRVLAAPGDVVTAGQALVELESAEVGRARANVGTTKARLDLARQTVERRRLLAADQIVSQRELQAAEAELAQAEAEHRGAQQTLSGMGALRGSGARFTLRSPIAGTNIERTALRGRMVDAEHSLFIVADLRRLWLVVHAFERDALRVRTGTTARVTFAALPGQTFSGTVTWIGARVDPSSRTIDVRIEVDNFSGLLRPGMSGSALLPLGSSGETVVAVPAAALQRVRDGWCVFIPRDEATFEVRPVGRGRDFGGEVEVLSGLRPGESVVVGGAFLLKAEHDKAHGEGRARTLNGMSP